jgi:hypothetical protein
MHRVWGIVEIVRHFVDAIPSDQHSALFALALTSRLLSTFALDRLWTRVPHLYFLAVLMPDNVRYILNNGAGPRTIVSPASVLWSDLPS